MLKPYLYAGVVLTIIGAGTGLYVKGQHDAKAAAKAEARKELLEQMTERDKVNENVSRMSAAELCRELGGVWRNGQCE